MHIARSMLLVLAGVLVAAVLAAQAAAIGPTRYPVPVRTQSMPAPTVPVVVKTVAALPASAYPWAQPVWVPGRGAVGVVQLPAARLAGVQPVFVRLHGAVVPELP